MSSIQSLIRPVYFVELSFDNDPVRVNTSAKDVDWNGETWTGLGVLTEISSMGQNIEMRTDNLSVQLSGVPLSSLAEAKTHKYRGRRAVVHYGLFDEDWALLPDPQIVFKGKMDAMATEVSGDSATIGIEIVSDMADWQRANTYRYTDNMQKDRYPDDKGLEFVTAQSERALDWGVKNTQEGNGGQWFQPLS